MSPFWAHCKPFWPLQSHKMPWKWVLFETKSGSKMGPKCVVPKMLLDYLGCTNKWNEPILSPCWAILAPLKAERALKMGHFGTTNASKTGQNHGFKGRACLLMPAWMSGQGGLPCHQLQNCRGSKQGGGSVRVGWAAAGPLNPEKTSLTSLPFPAVLPSFHTFFAHLFFPAPPKTFEPGQRHSGPVILDIEHIAWVI
jgi:hypothetical protein